MYQILLPLHSIIRWLLVVGILFNLTSSLLGLTSKGTFTKTDNFFRSFTSGISHIQLIIGLLLYFKSPITTYFRNNTSEAIHFVDIAFYGVFHIACMVISVLLITIGAAKAKRANTDLNKHKQIALWFGIATLLILIAIPWPFNPYASRPYFRPF